MKLSTSLKFILAELLTLNRAIEKIMMKFEGKHTVFDIAEQVGLDYWVVREYVEKFCAMGFIRALPIPSEADLEW